MSRRNFLFPPVLDDTSAKSMPCVWPTIGGMGVARLVSFGGALLNSLHAGQSWQWSSMSLSMWGHQ